MISPSMHGGLDSAAVGSGACEAEPTGGGAATAAAEVDPAAETELEGTPAAVDGSWAREAGGVDAEAQASRKALSQRVATRSSRRR